jgi:uncharacterized protein YjdB
VKVLSRYSARIRLRLRGVIAIVCAVSLSCGGGEGITGVAPVASVSVVIPTTSLVVGTTTQASATMKDSGGNLLSGRALTWSSSSTDVASVSQTGEVTALKPGSAEIKATSEGKDGSASVTVIPPPVATVTVTLASSTVAVGRTTTARAALADASGKTLTDRTVSWASSNVAVATVNNDGLVTAVATGDATITATSEGKTGSASVSVVPAPIANITVVFADAQLRVGSSTKAAAIAKDENGNVLTSRPVVWTSDHAEIAAVNSEGIVVGVAPGTANIIATSEGKVGSAPMTISTVPLATITVTVASPTLTIGSTTQATAVAEDENGNVLTGRTFTWTTDHSEVATVNAQGVVTAVGRGTATITATSEGKSGNTGIAVGSNVSQVVVALPQSGLSVGYSVQASYTVKDEAGNSLTGQTVTWSSSNSAVATVNQSGVVTGASAGTADIKATIGGTTGSATIGIVVIKRQSLSAGANHTCAISIDGDAYCWGYNTSGQLGDGTTTDRLSPVRVAGEFKFSAIAAKSGSTYALTSDGRLFCWGSCQRGELALAPRQVQTRRAIYLLGNDVEGNCAIGVGNVGYCWGSNASGQLGPDTPVAGEHSFVDIGSGSYTACAIEAGGAAYCWGTQYPGDPSSVPTLVPGGYSFKDLAGGSVRFCGLTDAGTTYCWTGSAPVAVEGSYVFESISGGWLYTCGITPAGDPYCWGNHPYGQPNGLIPVSFRHWSFGPDPYASVKYRLVSPGTWHVCATSTEGDIYCMNHYTDNESMNLGEVGLLGDGTRDTSRAVRKVIGGIKFRTQ